MIAVIIYRSCLCPLLYFLHEAENQNQLNKFEAWLKRTLANAIELPEDSGVRPDEYWDKRVRMMQHWSNHLDFLRDGAKVIKGELQQAKAGH